MFRNLLIIIFLLMLSPVAGAETLPEVYDLTKAKEVCSMLPLENVEGIWVYPEDKVTVLILRERDRSRSSAFPEYRISVVESEDTKLLPGDILGKLTATAQPGVFAIELATEKKNELLLKPRSVTATLGNEDDTFIFKRTKSGLKGRLNLNLSRLLPGFWKMISTGISTSGGKRVETPVGMIKIYPSYDGNGNSRREIIYL